MTMSRERRASIQRSPGPATTTFPITTPMNTRTPSNRARAPAPTRAAALESRRVAGRLGGAVIGIALWGLRVGHGRWALAGGLNRPPRGGCGVRLEGGRGTYPPGGGAKASGSRELVTTL